MRIWINPFRINSVTRYFGGAEYKDRKREAGGNKSGGEMNYDAYCSLLNCKQNMGKFYFTKKNKLVQP